jgi:hypothetical protein
MTPGQAWWVVGIACIVAIPLWRRLRARRWAILPLEHLAWMDEEVHLFGDTKRDPEASFQKIMKRIDDEDRIR